MKCVNPVAPALAVLGILSLPAFAASHTWSGAVNGDWSNAGNWSVGGAPADGEANVQLVFPAGATTTAMTNDVTGLAVTSIDFQSTAYSLAGSTFDLGGTIGVSAGTLFGVVGITNPVALTGSSAFVCANDLSLSFDGVVSGASGFTISSTGGFGGGVRFTAANSFSGVATVVSGYLYADHALALGFTDGTSATGIVVQSGGTLSVNGVTIAGEALSVGGSGANGNAALQGYGAAVWAGPVTLTADTVFLALTGNSLLVSGDIDDGGSGYAITFRAAGGITLSGNSSYGGPGFGPDRIEYGTVTMSGSSFAGIDTNTGGTGGGVLRGTGSVWHVNSGGAGTTNNGIAPGTAAATAVFSPTSVSMDVNSSLAIRINGPTAGTDYDQLAVSGETTLSGATLSVTLGYAAPVGTVFTIVSNGEGGGVTGTFAGLPNASTFVAGGETFRIDYGVGPTSSDITLTVTSITPVSLQSFDAE